MQKTDSRRGRGAPLEQLLGSAPSVKGLLRGKQSSKASMTTPRDSLNPLSPPPLAEPCGSKTFSLPPEGL